MVSVADKSDERIYIAPLQGFTDHFFRNAFIPVFGNPTAAFSPFIETHRVDSRSYRDVLPERNVNCLLIPQIMGNNATEMIYVIKQLEQLGYDEVNWNLGCPYPMITNKIMGAGLLPHADRIDSILNEIFVQVNCRFSVKMRLGNTNCNEWKTLLPVLNRYPLSEVIIHGRTASQMYKGEIDETAFGELSVRLKHPVCYNGNIFTLKDYQRLSVQFPNVSRWMIGRGLLFNPLLLNEIRTGDKVNKNETREALGKLHDQLLYQFSSGLNGESHVLNKIKPYWEYFCHSFSDQAKCLKKIKKAISLDVYKMHCNELFLS